MAVRVEEDGEPIEGDEVATDGDGIEHGRHNSDHAYPFRVDSADRSTQGHCDMRMFKSTKPIAASGAREDIGFQRSRRILHVPDWAFREGEVDDGTRVGLAVADRFGVMLISYASGKPWSLSPISCH